MLERVKIPHHLQRLVQLPGGHYNQLFLGQADRWQDDGLVVFDTATTANSAAATAAAPRVVVAYNRTGFKGRVSVVRYSFVFIVYFLVHIFVKVRKKDFLPQENKDSKI